MKLFEPDSVGRILIKNRIVMAPMHAGGLAETDGGLSQRCIDYYVARARGGAGLIITTPHGIRRGIKSYKMWISELADAAHDYNVKVAVQLGSWTRTLGAIAPSALPCFLTRKNCDKKRNANTSWGSAEPRF